MKAKVWRPYLPWLVAAAALMVFLFNLRTIASYDYFWHLRLGETMLDRVALPFLDTFSYTAQGHPLFFLDWLADGLFAIAHQAGGFTATCLLRAALLSLAFLLTLRLLHRSGGIWAALALGLLLIPIQPLRSAMRPELLVYIFIPLVLTALEKSGKHAFWVPLIALVWSNTHASVIICVGIAGAYFLAAAIRACKARELKQALSPLLVWLLTLAGASLNPSGPALFIYSLGVGATADFKGVTEFASPTLLQLVTDFPAPFFLLITVIPAALLPRARLEHRILALTGALFMLWAVRFMVIGLMLMLPLLACLIPWLREKGGWKAWAPMALALLLAGVQMTKAFFPPLGIGITPDHYPEKTAQLIETESLKGPMFHELSVGGYLLWRLPKGPRVFIDGRSASLYGPALLARYKKAFEGPRGFTDLNQQYNFNLILVSERYFTIPFQRMGFALIHLDERFALFLRRHQSNAPHLRKLEFKHLFLPNLVAPLLTRQNQGQLVALLDEVHRALYYSPDNPRALLLGALLTAELDGPGGQAEKMLARAMKLRQRLKPGMKRLAMALAQRGRIRASRLLSAIGKMR